MTTVTRIPPHDVQLEQTALGAALFSADVTRTLAGVSDDLFYFDRHRIIRQALAELAATLNGVPPNLALLKATTERAGHPVDDGLLALLFEAGVAVVDVSKYIAMLADLAAAREEFAAAEMVRVADERDRLRDAGLWRAVSERLSRAQALRTASTAVEPKPLEAHALLGMEFPDQPAIVGKGVLPRSGLAVLAGPPKKLKSVAVTNLALARPTRQSWLGFPTSPGRTLLVQAELTPAALQERTALMLAGLAAPLPADTVYFESTRSLRLDEPSGLAALRRKIDAVEPDLLIIDPLARFMVGDENSTRDMGRVVAALDTLVEASGMAILVVHHTRKPGEAERSGGERLRGSSALFAAVDSVLLLDRHDAETLTLTMELRHGAEHEPLLLRRTPNLWLLPAGPSQELLDVAGLVATLPMRWSFFVKAIEQDLEKPKRTAQRLLDRARDAGLVALNEDKLYATTASYRQAVSGGEKSAND